MVNMRPCKKTRLEFFSLSPRHSDFFNSIHLQDQDIHKCPATIYKNKETNWDLDFPSIAKNQDQKISNCTKHKRYKTFLWKKNSYIGWQSAQYLAPNKSLESSVSKTPGRVVFLYMDYKCICAKQGMVLSCFGQK